MKVEDKTYINNITNENVIYKINNRKDKIFKYIMDQRYQNLNKLKKIKICQDLYQYTEK